MSDNLATYSFLPWLRQGLSNDIPQDDNTAAKTRAAINVRLTVSPTNVDGTAGIDQEVKNDVELYGPGDIVGIDTKAIVKTEPRDWITNFEPNYFPYIDFYEEDFPWRYTPARPGSDRLRPWITLVALDEDEFENGQNIKDKPLPFFKLKSGVITAGVFPKAAELWAWAHVHVNTDLSNGAAPNTADAPDVNRPIADLIAHNPDRAYSRIICPRKLKPNTGYHAFVIPTFESGRLAGLGSEIPANLGGTTCSWEDAAHVEFPYYHRWYFRTGTKGDFEYLVNLLKPKPANKNVGVRDMDVLHPGANLPPINDFDTKGILKLGGALRVPFDSLKEIDKQEVYKFELWDELPYPAPFTTAMARRINLADDYADEAKSVEVANKAADVTAEGDTSRGDPDPVITSPLYGRWHGLQQRLLKSRANADLPNNRNWIHELNLDPRFRVAAGLGTKVVQKNQEEYMLAAWEQVGKLIEANNRIRFAQLAKEVSEKWYRRHLAQSPPGQAFVLTAPVQTRTVHHGTTVRNQVEESVIPPAVTCGKFRNITRPRGRAMKILSLNQEVRRSLIERINDGEVIVVPPKTDPKGGINLGDLSKDAGVQPAQTPEAVDKFPHSPDFKISTPDSGFEPRTGTTDSEEAAKFKQALKDAFIFVNIKSADPVRKRLNFVDLVNSTVTQLNPAITIPRRTFASVKIPQRVLDNMVETFTPVMAYPEIDVPMYKPLAEISSEFFLPNLKLIEENSITLLENNQKFIESYMVGINHEAARELLWREYPTDQRGSYFRQFWDVSGFMPPQPVPADLKEQLRDIPPIHTWSKTNTSPTNPDDPHSPRVNELGQHNQRALQSGKTQLVLVIRGELLKKYPTAVIYAHKADWGTNPTTHAKDVEEERVFVELSGPEIRNPPTTKVQTPLFEAKIDPDVYFFGFDLDDEEARGTLNPTAITDDPGWFFVIKERPGEPRFGLDIDKAKNDSGAARLINWNNLSWEDLETADGACVEINQTFTLTAYDPILDQENKANPDDVQASWSPATNAAELAYILYQVPVLVGVHASRMLPEQVL